MINFQSQAKKRILQGYSNVIQKGEKSYSDEHIKKLAQTLPEEALRKTVSNSPKGNHRMIAHQELERRKAEEQAVEEKEEQTIDSELVNKQDKVKKAFEILGILDKSDDLQINIKQIEKEEIMKAKKLPEGRVGTTKKDLDT